MIDAGVNGDHDDVQASFKSERTKSETSSMTWRRRTLATSPWPFSRPLASTPRASRMVRSPLGFSFFEPHTRSGVLRTHKLRSRLLRTQSRRINVGLLLPGVDQNIAKHAFRPRARNFFLVLISTFPLEHSLLCIDRRIDRRFLTFVRVN